ncbi:unnamed protein product, partial [Effrenium voratum]
VPAGTVHEVAQAAREEVGDKRLGQSRVNASRDAHRFIAKWGLAWKVPISHMTVGDGGDKISVPFISPADFVQFLLAKAPELVLGGFTKLESGQEDLKSFWSCYQKVHPGHGMFSQDGHVARWPTTLALSLHGDEGRGLKKGNTCVIMLESNLGLQTCHGQTKRKVNDAMDAIAERFCEELRRLVGIFRDFLGASILLLCKFSYFNFDGQSNRRELQLERAFGHFRLWCASVGKTPGLHSFTPLFFNAPNQNTFGWVNSKGSDSMMLLSWIQVALAAFQRDLIDPSHAETLRIMQRCAQHADAFTNMTYDHGLWLSRHCAAKLYSDMHLFLTAYNTLAFWSLHKWQFTAYGMKAKYHML